jgi:hypothetical protein
MSRGHAFTMICQSQFRSAKQSLHNICCRQNMLDFCQAIIIRLHQAGLLSSVLIQQNPRTVPWFTMSQWGLSIHSKLCNNQPGAVTSSVMCPTAAIIRLHNNIMCEYWLCIEHAESCVMRYAHTWLDDSDDMLHGAKTICSTLLYRGSQQPLT